MSERVKFKQMMEVFREVVGGLADWRRKGNNTKYALGDGVMAAFAMFYMQSASFLAYQRDMERKKGRNNARSLFGIENIP